MEVVHHADRGAVFPSLRHLFVVLFYYTLLLSLAKGTTTLIIIVIIIITNSSIISMNKSFSVKLTLSKLN